jgi:hypothetical protein
VAVLNGTAEGGLAATFAQDLKSAANYDVGPVSNTAEPFTASVVMFDAGAEESARQVGAQLGITDVQPMSVDIRSVSEGAQVAVVLGEDQATGASSTEGTTDTTSGTSGF